MNRITHKSNVVTLLCCIIAVLFSTSSRATHIVGGELTYTRLNDTTYTFTMSLYGDCSDGSATMVALMPGSKPVVCIFDGSTSYGTDSLYLDSAASGLEIPTICGTTPVTQCVNTSSTIPGVKRYVYKKDIVLPHTSANWRVVYNGYNAGGGMAGLAASITNISSASGYVMQIEAQVNSTIGNSSVVYHNTVSPFYCLNSPISYLPSVTDAESDSVYYQMIAAPTNPIASAGSCRDTSWAMNYISPYTGTAPLAASSFTFDNHLGIMSFTPSLLQRSMVVYKADEYRAGVWVGSTQRVMTVKVIVCGPGCGGVGVTNVEQDDKITIQPNPASSILDVNVNQSIYESVTVTDMMGRAIWQQQVKDRTTQIDVSEWPAGVYIISLKGNNMVKVQRVVISR